MPLIFSGYVCKEVSIKKEFLSTYVKAEFIFMEKKFISIVDFSKLSVFIWEKKLNRSSWYLVSLCGVFYSTFLFGMVG